LLGLLPEAGKIARVQFRELNVFNDPGLQAASSRITDWQKLGGKCRSVPSS
jgi:hypothetical protein